MKKTVTLLGALFIGLNCFAQNGINYKALIKDVNGNIVVSSPLNIQFIIYEGAALSNNVYQESQTLNTDANGLVIVNIGDGTTSDVFSDINWADDEHFLNVQINTGSGLVDLGTTQFMPVPYAKVAEKAANVTGLEAIDEGNGVGWRLTGRNPDNYGDIGFNAIDFTYSNINSSLIGATGNYASTYGFGTYASGQYSTAIGAETQATGSSAMATGRLTEAIGNYSSAFGLGTQSQTFASLAIGRFNLGGGSATTWNDSEALFEIGNGTSINNRSNALTVLKNGQTTINSEGTGLIIPNSINGINIFDSQSNSVNIINSGFRGIYIDNPELDGILISGAQDDGIEVSALDRGGSFVGGNVGIYTSASNSSNPDIILGGNSSANAEDDGIISSDPLYNGSDIYLRSNDAVVIELDNDDNSSGSFFVRNGDDTNVFTVNESGNATLAGSLTQNSDRRLKQDVDDLPYGLNEILQLQPKQYFWKTKAQEKKSLGLIAQDVQPIINEIVNIKDDEFKTLGISYTELIPVLINAIQEQQKIIDNEKSVNAKQNLQLEALLSRVQDLETNQSN